MTLRYATSILLLCLVASFAIGCGSDDEGSPLPSDSAVSLENQLNNVEERLGNGSVGACNDILGGDKGPNTTSVDQLISGLPDDVDGDVVQALRDGFNRLFDLVDERCTELEDDQDQTEDEPVLPPDTETNPPDTTTEPPATVPTTPTQPETTPTTPPDQGGTGTPGQGNGNGNGNGGTDDQGDGGGALVPEATG